MDLNKKLFIKKVESYFNRFDVDTIIGCLDASEIDRSDSSVKIEAVVSDDFCGDCGHKFLEGANKITGGKSTLCGEYYKQNSHPICDECAEKRYEKKMAEYESKNSR